MWYDVKYMEEFLEIKKDGTVRTKDRLLKYIRCGKPMERLNKSVVLTPQKDRDGYFRVNIKINQKTFNRIVHRLLAQTFITNPFNKPCVNHKDGNKQNNNLNNLEWVTNQENVDHAKLNGLVHTPKIPNELVQEIKDKYSTGNYTQRDLAKIYNTQHSNIWWVLNKR